MSNIYHRNGQMTWREEADRAVAVGYVSNSGRRDYDVASGGLYTQLDQMVLNSKLGMCMIKTKNLAMKETILLKVKKNKFV